MMAARKFITALSILTAIPVPQRWANSVEGASLYFPVVGLLMGALYYISAAVMLMMQFSVGGAAWGIFLIQFLFTRGFHMDGLADMADGFLGGFTREDRLRIMKDTHAGTFGVVAVVLLVLGKWIAISAVFEKNLLWIIPLAAILSRFAITLLAAVFPYARTSGTGHQVVTLTRPVHAILGVLFTGIASYSLAGPGGLLILSGIVTAGLLFGLLSMHFIGGITGDILGAGSELTELLVLATTPIVLQVFPVWFHGSMIS